MKKREIYEAFNRKISQTCIVKRDDEWVVQGKYCVIAPEENGVFDIWICNPDDLYAGLSQRKVRNIIRIMEKSPVGTQFRELTGEADAKVQGTELILQNLQLLGIKKKRQFSDQTAKKMANRLNEARKAA